MAKDIGGPGGSGGPLGDAASLNIPDVTEGRNQIDYGTRNENNEAFTPANIRTTNTDSLETIKVIFQAQLDDLLLVKQSEDDDVFTIIAKPPLLRKSEFDTEGEENESGEILAYIGNGIRTKIVNGIEIQEEIYPSYVIGEDLFAFQVEDSGVTSINLQEINMGARRWEDRTPKTKYFRVLNIDRDTYDCREWDWLLNNGSGGEKVDAEGNPVDETVIAKPVEIRGTFWDFTLNGGNEILNIQYDVQGGSEEGDSFTSRLSQNGTVEEDEDQIIIPPFATGVTIIRADYVPEGTGAYREGTQAIWQDCNDAGRAFALEFE